MFTFLLILLILDSLLLVVAILLQSGKGQGLAASFGGASSSSDAFIGMRQAGNVLTKASWWCGGIFLGLSFVLSLMSARNTTPRSILEDQLRGSAAPAAPAPSSPATAAPAVPLTPAPTTPAAPAQQAPAKP